MNTMRIDPTRPIHVTERREYRTCRRKWWLAFVERLTPKNEIAKADALYLGSGGHYALEHYYRHQIDNPGDLLPLIPLWEAYKLGEAIQPEPDQDEMMKGVLNYYEQYAEVNDEHWRILDVEQRFRIQIPGTNIILTGAFDVIAEDLLNGGIWIWDHKFLSQLPQFRHLEMDDQMTAYIWIAHQVGLKVRGVIYNAIKKKAPSPPMILKNGQLSKNKMQDTTLDLYEAAIEENGLDREEYQDILDFLAAKPNAFIMREKVTRNKYELAHFEELVRMEIDEMSNPNTYIYPNLGYHCSWCAFQPLCKIMNEGGDHEYTAQEMYRKKLGSER